MNPIHFALRQPIAMLMMAVAVVGGGGLALQRMRVDIFPPINQPTIYVYVNYNGMTPSQVEGLITNNFERVFQFVDGVKQIESKSIQQVCLIKLSFYPDTDMSAAMGQVVAWSNRALAMAPPGTQPAMVLRLDPGSVPVGYLVMKSKKTSLSVLSDLALNRLRPMIQTEVPGTAAIPPFGPNARSILINVDLDRLRARNLSPNAVVQALKNGNAIVPGGNLYVRDQMPMVATNVTVPVIEGLGSIPVEAGRNIYIRDVATIEDGADISFGYALVNGRKSLFIPIVKKDTASTLEVADRIHASLPLFRSILPEDVELTYEFDDSPVVRTAMTSVATEALIGACLTGLMILLFLHDWRSVLVVVLNIPLALLGSLFALCACGQTVNIMTLGGLALAVGILVDEATVEIENFHAQMRTEPSLPRAVVKGNAVTAVPRFLALLCILSVFIPAYIMAEPVRSLFLPLSLAVGFAMISSYILSGTLVPVIAVYVLKHQGAEAEHHGLFDRLQRAFSGVVRRSVAWRWLVLPVYGVVCALVLGLVGSRLGTELFPQVNANEYVLRFRAPPGSSYEITRQLAVKCLEVMGEEAGPGNIAISMGFAGQIAPDWGLNNLVLFMRGPDDGQLRVALREGSGINLAEFRERLRRVLPEKVVPWLTDLLQREGLPPAEAAARARKVVFGFEPGDMISEVMSFGAPTPIEVIVISPNLAHSREFAARIRGEMAKISCLRDLQIQQELDYPTVEVDIDREKAGLSGATAREVADSILVGTTSSRLMLLNYWQDQRTGLDYQVQVQVPINRMTSREQVEILPVEPTVGDISLLVRDVARFSTSTTPGEYDRQAMQRYLSITANVEGEDLGRAARQIEEALAAAGTPPRGVRVQVQGQIKPMNEMFHSLAVGLAVAVAVILVLLTAYFESPRLALTALGAVPGVLSGVVLMLYLTGTTLNIESFMGSIMCVGVSVSNSVMLVTFMAARWQEGAPTAEAAVGGAASRLRAILMTAGAMTIGMLPMALALEAGTQMLAPLGRAVIGGLVFSTFTTLLVLPALFTALMGRRAARSTSLHPDDPASAHYVPESP